MQCSSVLPIFNMRCMPYKRCRQAAMPMLKSLLQKPWTTTEPPSKPSKSPGKIVQIGSQRRSGANYHAANDFIKSGKFGPIKMVELTWNVNQPGRWRRPELSLHFKRRRHRLEALFTQPAQR